MLKWFARLALTEKIIFAFTIIIIGFAAVKAFYYTSKYGGTDLRVDIVGTRALHANHSPYFYHWEEGHSERLVNPNGYRVAINGVTVAPGMLYVYSLISWMDYPTIRFVWSIIQYLLMIFIFLYGFGKISQWRKKEIYAFLICGIVFLGSELWLQNIERGQKYVFYAFLFCITHALLHSNRKILLLLAGIIMAAAIYCRPTFALALIPFIWKPNRWLIAGFLLAALPLLLHAFTHQQLWKDYQKSMKISTKFERIDPASKVYPIYPQRIIEGASNLREVNTSLTIGGIRPLPTYFKHPDPNERYIYVLLYFLIVIATLFVFKTHLSTFSMSQSLLLGFFLYIVAEYFIPNNRGGYNPIQWAFPVILILRGSRTWNLNWILIPIGCGLMLNFPFTFPFFHSIGEALLLISLITFIVSDRHSGKRPPDQLIDG